MMLSVIFAFLLLLQPRRVVALEGDAPTAVEFDFDGVRASIGLDSSVNSLTYRELQERRELIQRRMRDHVEEVRLVLAEAEHVGQRASPLAPKLGVAVHINAFNFPVWGFAEKAAAALSVAARFRPFPDRAFSPA